jgi:hypothetical protein
MGAWNQDGLVDWLSVAIYLRLWLLSRGQWKPVGSTLFSSDLHWRACSSSGFPKGNAVKGLRDQSPSVSQLSRKCGILGISQSCRPPRTVTEIVSPLFFTSVLLKTAGLCWLQPDYTSRWDLLTYSWTSSEFPAIHRKPINILLQFLTSFICEEVFPCLTSIKSRERNCLISVEDELHVCLSKHGFHIEEVISFFILV